MDGVLVKQTASDGFDSMPWTPDGKELWAFISGFHPVILSMLPDQNVERCGAQKREWVRRELGESVEVVIALRSAGKGPHATTGAVLIDDDVRRHAPAWIENGGVFVHHVSADESIRRLRGLGFA